ncbi:MAG: NADH-quinone oxidoreductase subunit NuoE [Burkholderiaceae bacterium]|jgi:NADH-quinone oxidoreductase subunit E|uniref:NADH-quinone oxidoreductase subunit NuoE n=1 Tax=Polynucleobacter sp. MWH-Loch1C5 TaxID=2689108 RepID=UPI001C0CD2A3|nr:NADH-quinone oxidoreductase subunit NuoE [Polynucleobacter sp. MWH-Loch1C5]MBU3542894.1 NADH-quinone oxidoreductase subunit NuoE [Polynucleobacter sp. MWH-Loch1C5]NBV00625.1 NADH-quinone oxidoreductase subunit NuoE [Burkholderiaceae bacterium]
MLSQQARAEIDRNVAKYPADQKQSAVMAALVVAQDEYGWVSPEAIEEVAQILDMPPIAVQEVATFYNMYDTQTVGRFKITVCTNLPCELSGGARAGEYLKKKLGIDYNQTTACGTFTLKEGECMGACGDAPVALVNNKTMCSFMSNEKLDALIEDLKAQGAK